MNLNFSPVTMLAHLTSLEIVCSKIQNCTGNIDELTLKSKLRILKLTNVRNIASKSKAINLSRLTDLRKLALINVHPKPFAETSMLSRLRRLESLEIGPAKFVGRLHLSDFPIMKDLILKDVEGTKIDLGRRSDGDAKKLALKV